LDIGTIEKKKKHDFAQIYPFVDPSMPAPAYRDQFVSDLERTRYIYRGIVPKLFLFRFVWFFWELISDKI